jgi:hypothetical protein
MAKVRRFAAVTTCAAVLTSVTFMLAGCVPASDSDAPAATPSVGAAPWPAPADAARRAEDAGQPFLAVEKLDYHAHAHLDVFVNGDPVVVPRGIGIDMENPGVAEFPAENGQGPTWGIRDFETGCPTPCISSLHTHGDDGVVHIEAASESVYTLGQFFTEWGVRLSESCIGERCSPDGIAFYVDGKPNRQDPRAIELTDRKEIAIVIGTPPPEIPKTADFSNA